MADDLDDLLDEVEKSLEKKDAPPPPPKLTAKSTSASKGTSDKIDDLNDLLSIDVDDDDVRRLKNSATSRNPTSATSLNDSTTTSKKCSVVVLAGTGTETGMASAATIRACDRLRCISCDFDVVAFGGFAWIAGTDYLFLRNHMPDRRHLQKRLEASRSSRAYACQCQHRSVSAVSTVTASNVQWVCCGH
ncbi:cilia- and flagella-associated protein 418-like [Oratosquilla oratoria]|uniref:cilia- and flagella-associated protein 418-like n=1 Tax=Oratosquilla oratoria TaxID=337810 RepID=UPI003F759D24